jgi:hypothetical protein
MRNWGVGTLAEARHSPCTEPAQVASTSVSVAMKCFLVRVQLSTLAVGHARSMDLPSWVARRVDLRSEPTRSIEDMASLSVYARGTSCACGLLDHSAEVNGRSWRLTKQAGAALANLFHRLGTKVSPGSFLGRSAVPGHLPPLRPDHRSPPIRRRAHRRNALEGGALLRGVRPEPIRLGWSLARAARLRRRSE